MTRRTIPLRQRVDAVVAATRLMDSDRSEGRHAAWLPVLLGEQRVDLGRVRAVLDLLLAEGPESCADGVAHLRVAVARFEVALGLDHDPRSAEALQAWERYVSERSGPDAPGRDAWHAYVAGVVRP